MYTPAPQHPAIHIHGRPAAVILMYHNIIHTSLKTKSCLVNPIRILPYVYMHTYFRLVGSSTLILRFFLLLAFSLGVLKNCKTFASFLFVLYNKSFNDVSQFFPSIIIPCAHSECISGASFSTTSLKLL